MLQKIARDINRLITGNEKPENLKKSTVFRFSLLYPDAFISFQLVFSISQNLLFLPGQKALEFIHEKLTQTDVKKTGINSVTIKTVVQFTGGVLTGIILYHPKNLKLNYANYAGDR